MLSDSTKDFLFILYSNLLEKTQLKENLLVKTIKKSFNISDFEVYNDEPIIVGDNKISFAEENFEFEQTIFCCRLSKDKLAFSQGKIVALTSMTQIDKYEYIVDNKLSIKFIEFGHNSE